MTGSLNRCSPCVEYVLSSWIPYQTCITVLPSPTPPVTPNGFGGNLQQPYPPNVNPPNINQTWAWYVSEGVQKGNVYWWNVEDQQWE